VLPASPLDDPAYEPEHPPVAGQIPAVVARWGPRSQVRWFRRFGAVLGRRRDWDRYYCHTEHHLGLHCTSCEEEGDMGTQGFGYCCCQDKRVRR
jgi:hypothetical protein